MSIQGVSGDVANSDANAEQQRQSDKELNFAKLREKEERAQRELDAQRQETQRLSQEIERLKSRYTPPEEDMEDDSEPYVETKKLKKILSQVDRKIEEKAEEKAKKIFEEMRKQDYLGRLKTDYRDYDEVVNDSTIAKLGDSHPELANELMTIGDEYRRRSAAYHAIKSLRLNQKIESPSIQDKINQNMRNPYHIPSSTGNPPSMAGDFSEAGKKSARDQMVKLMAKAPGMPR